MQKHSNRTYDEIVIEINDKRQIEVFPDLYDLLNAFQHAYNSAYLTYKYSAQLAILLGDLKEIITWNSEPNIQDRNRDLWNNAVASQYAITMKNNNINFSTISENIFLNIIGENSSYITDLDDNETRLAIGSDDFLELIQHFLEVSGDSINIPKEFLNSVYNPELFDEITKVLNEEYTKPDTLNPGDINTHGSGTEQPTQVFKYTSKPNMLSKDELFFLAFKEKKRLF